MQSADDYLQLPLLYVSHFKLVAEYADDYGYFWIDGEVAVLYFSAACAEVAADGRSKHWWRTGWAASFAFAARSYDWRSQAPSLLACYSPLSPHALSLALCFRYLIKLFRRIAFIPSFILEFSTFLRAIKYFILEYDGDEESIAATRGSCLVSSCFENTFSMMISLLLMQSTPVGTAYSPQCDADDG